MTRSVARPALGSWLSADHTSQRDDVICPEPKAGFLSRIGLDRPELRAWAMYDWANSAFQSTVINAVFPPFFSSYAAAGLESADATARFAWATTIAVTITAIIGDRKSVV